MLSNSFVTVIVDRNEIKGNLTKKQKIKLAEDKNSNSWILIVLIAARIRGNNSDVTLTCRRITNFNFL